MQAAHRIGPPLPEQLAEGGARRWQLQRIVGHGAGIPDIIIIGDDIVIAGQHHRQTARQQAGGVLAQPRHPGQLVIIFGPRRRIAVGQIEAGDPHAHHIGFKIARLLVAVVAGQAALHLGGGLAAEDGDAVEALLAVDKAVIARLAQPLDREIFGYGLDLLQAGDVGPGRLQPFEQARQAGVGAVDVEGGDQHGATLGVFQNTEKPGGQRVFTSA